LSEKTYYRPGLVFKAHEKSRGHQEICRKEYKQFATDGTMISETRALIAEFAVHGGEYSYVNPDGVTDRAADIRLGWFDLDTQAEQKGWSPEEKEIVARHMTRMAEARPGGDFTLWSKPAAVKPWPTYDETPADQIPVIAKATGTTGDAVVYESENKNRKTVLAKLQDELEKAQSVDAESLTAA
jgi:hypothetical protein